MSPSTKRAAPMNLDRCTFALCFRIACRFYIVDKRLNSYLTLPLFHKWTSKRTCKWPCACVIYATSKYRLTRRYFCIWAGKQVYCIETMKIMYTSFSTQRIITLLWEHLNRTRDKTPGLLRCLVCPSCSITNMWSQRWPQITQATEIYLNDHSQEMRKHFLRRLRFNQCNDKRSMESAVEVTLVEF